MNKASNLATRKGSSNYYYRESVPLDVQAIMARNGSASKNEIWKSLRTSSIQEAKIALVPVRAEQHRAWNDIRAHDVKKFVTPTDDELKTAAVTNGYDRAFEIQSTAFKANVTAETLDAELHKRRDSLRRRALNPSERGDIERLAKSIVKNEKWLLDDEHLEQFRKYLNEAVLDSLNAIVEVFEGKPMPEPQSSLVRQVRERNLIKAPVGETLSELFERYQKAMTASGRKGKSSLQDAKIVIDQFGNFVGSKRAIRSITKAEARNFRDAFSSAPSRWNLRKEFRGLTLTQAGKKAEVEDWPLRSAKTVAKAISDISAFYTWAIKEGYADDNPTYGLKPSTNRDEGRLPSYQPEQLRSFFESPLFSGCDSRVGKKHLRGNKKVRDWRYWIPIISLFTGARVAVILHRMWIDGTDFRFNSATKEA